MNHYGTIILLILVCAVTRLTAQDEYVPPPVPDMPRMYVDALDYWNQSDGTSRLDVYVQVPFDALHFAKVDSMFRATYDVTIDVNDSTEKLVTERYWTEHIETKSYDESISPTAGRISKKSFTLKPGEYKLAILMNDQDTKKNIQIKRTARIRDFEKDTFALSDMMVVNRVDTLSDKRAVYPNISGNVANVTSGFFLFFEVYKRMHLDSTLIRLRVRDLKGAIVRADTIPEALASTMTSVFLKVKDSNLVAGDYFIELRCYPMRMAGKDEDKNLLASASRPFAIHWHGLPVSIVDLDQAIEELQYITDKDVIDEMKNAPPEKKKEMFKTFWKKIDPTPGTERNELMEEYYSRVEYANKHFSHYFDGWKTDMGMVYIIFGVPSNIERHPFEIDSKPYEIWTYYDLDREFVFVDATGFGDYRLQNPIWDLWRTRPH